MIALVPYDPRWPDAAAQEIDRWHAAIGPALVACHHIGSTAVPGLLAKPIIDLLPLFSDAAAADAARAEFEAMGYEWMGAFGLPRRRYARRDDPETGQRRFHAHGYASGDSEALRHLAFRDLLRAEPATRDAYAAIKTDCARKSTDREAYGACKSGWICKTEARALREMT